MTRPEFKKTYLDNSFFWINKGNHIKVQKILQEFGIRCHTGSGFIRFHPGFKNLVTFPPDGSHGFEYYQKTGFWVDGARYGRPVDLPTMFLDYESL